jgi:hypothetical protein
MAHGTRTDGALRRLWVALLAAESTDLPNRRLPRRLAWSGRHPLRGSACAIHPVLVPSCWCLPQGRSNNCLPDDCTRNTARSRLSLRLRFGRWCGSVLGSERTGPDRWRSRGCELRAASREGSAPSKLECRRDDSMRASRWRDLVLGFQREGDSCAKRSDRVLADTNRHPPTRHRGCGRKRSGLRARRQNDVVLGSVAATMDSARCCGRENRPVAPWANLPRTLRVQLGRGGPPRGVHRGK